MPKNTIEDMRNHLFAQLERLGDEEMNPEALSQEITRAKAITGVAQAIVNSAKVEVDMVKATRGEFIPSSSFMNKKSLGDGK